MPLMNSQGNGHIYVQSTQPTGWVNGDFYYDNVNNILYQNIGGTATTVSQPPIMAIALGK